MAPWRDADFAAAWGNVKAALPYFVPAALWGLAMALMPKVPDSMRATIDVTTLPYLDLALFNGWFPHQCLSAYNHIVYDLLCAVVYTLHFPLPFFYLAWVWRYRRQDFLGAVCCFGWLNLLGVTFQFLFPTAPPWYYDQYGTMPSSYVFQGQPGGLSRVDEYFGSQWYHNLYGKSPVVFGAFPSLHAAWPFFMKTFTDTSRWYWIHPIWIFLAASYLQHHYVVDLLGGALFALVVKYGYRLWQDRNSGTGATLMGLGGKDSVAAVTELDASHGGEV